LQNKSGPILKKKIRVNLSTMERYIHESYTHNLESPSEIVGIVTEALGPASVVDVGCGTGTFLHQFKKAGVSKILGIDGPWVNRQLLSMNLEQNEFREMNLEEPLVLNDRYDLAVCLEVAEHLDSKYADTLVTSLTGISDLILFSAAIPFQGGQNHVNEQWIAYWKEKFEANNFAVSDVFRPIFWKKDKVQWWYRQNMYLVHNRAISFDPSVFNRFVPYGINDYIHPYLYLERSKRHQDIVSGNEGFWFYIKLVLKKIRKSVFAHRD
jgi:hypothetical protein